MSEKGTKFTPDAIVLSAIAGNVYPGLVIASEPSAELKAGRSDPSMVRLSVDVAYQIMLAAQAKLA